MIEHVSAQGTREFQGSGPHTDPHTHHGHHHSTLGEGDSTGHTGTATHGLHDMMMAMSFHGGCNEVILFDFWSINSVGGLVGSMIGIFFLGILYEGLKFYREFLLGRQFSSVNYNNVVPVSEGDENSIASAAPESPSRSNTNTSVRVIQTNLLSRGHTIQTFLHLVQVILSYFLMLIAMTYNSWLFGAVIAGMATGYFLFGWKKTVMVEAEGGCH